MVESVYRFGAAGASVNEGNPKPSYLFPKKKKVVSPRLCGQYFFGVPESEMSCCHIVRRLTAQDSVF